MDTYVIYFNPIEYPGKYVVRKQSVTDDGKIKIFLNPTAIVESIEEARKAVPACFTFRFPRDPYDDRSIVETWL